MAITRKPSLERRHLAAVTAIAVEGSVHAASRALRRTQPAVSRLLTEAEALLGARLFERSARGCIPTAEGRPVLLHARFLLRSLEQLDAGLGPGRPRIALGCIPRAMHAFMPALLGALQDRAFDVRVAEGNSATLCAALDAATIDFAIARPETSPLAGDERFVFEPLYTDRTVVICGRANRDVSRGPVNLRSLLPLPWVLTLPETASRATLDTVVREAGAPPILPVLESRSFESNVAIVAASPRFLSVAPESVARRHARFGEIRIVNLRRALPPTRVMLAYSRLACETPVNAEFRALVRKVAGRFT
jgi:DNA-binding transcriptional LysR family regulator